MAKPESIHLLDRLTEHSALHTGVFFTYGADLAFFEEAVLHPLWQRGCRNNLVFADAKRYEDTIRDLGGSVTWVGCRYVLIPVAMGVMQSFHPKMALLLGHERGRLLIGSGNLTFTGFGHNHEVFTCLDWTSDEPDLQYILAQAWDLTKAVFQRWGHSREAQAILGKAEYVSEWILNPSQPSSAVQLLHTLEEPLIDQCGRVFGGEAIERITVLAPFLDDAAAALDELASRFKPRELRLVVQDQSAVGNKEALKRLRDAGTPLTVYRYGDDTRYLHAKVYLFQTGTASYALTGSANCTRSAWLLPSTDGNLEMMLLRRADSQDHFASLLEGRVASRPVTSLDEISIRPAQFPMPESMPSLVRLQDVSVKGGALQVIFHSSLPPDEIGELQLRLSTTPPDFIPLGQCGAGSQDLTVTIPPELQGALRRPMAASIWGVDSGGSPVDLHCNELWITFVDVLRWEIGRALPADLRTGGYLAAMALSSEEEWRELYESLAQLIELDVTGLRRRGGTYTASPPARRAKDDASEEQKTEVRLVDEQGLETREEEVAAVLFRESQFHAWFEHVCSRLAGAPPTPPEPEEEPEEEPDEPATLPGVGGERTRRRWTPSERVGRRFVNLVRKYIHSLANPEYMQTASLYHILTYYSVFQRIAWLLLQHEVIDAEHYVRLTVSINRGFFGSPDDGPPALCPLLERHVQRLWQDEWQTAETSFYALASVVSAQHLAHRADTGELEDQVREQKVRVLCGVASVGGVSWVIKHLKEVGQVGEVYGQDGDVFATEVVREIEISLPRLADELGEWVEAVHYRLGHAEDERREPNLLRARLDYGLARYDVLDLIRDVEEQAKLCSNLIFYADRAGDSEAERQSCQRLVHLLHSQGKGLEAARAMFGQGRSHFFGGEPEEAANVLRKALALAEHLDDEELSILCRQYLEYADSLLK